jgi:flagellar biosynthetic protein FliQ
LNEAFVLALGRQAILAIILICGSAVGLGMLVGLTVSVFQATTQINEQTLAFVPKILAVLVGVALFAPWMMRVALDFSERLILSIPDLVK